jgi:serine/threonine protein kinase
VTRKTLGKYEIIERIGRGGMAEVYRGYHSALDRYVAIKLLHPFLADDPEFKDRFEKEAKNVAKLRHPNIVQVFDFEYDSGGESYYMVMELIDGPTLKDKLFELAADNRRYSIAEATRIMIDTANALAYAHKRNMIHRDVKPANLMLDEDGRVVLTDFGIAKIVTSAQFTASGGMIGTPAYMAPEQGLGEAGDERSDIYSLGVIFYQMVTGRLPYDADTPLAVILKHVNDPLPDPREDNPDLPDWVVSSIQRSLEKNSEDRYQTSKEFLEALKQGHRVARGVTATGTLNPITASSVLVKTPDKKPAKQSTQSMRSVLDPTRKRITQTMPLDSASLPVKKEITSSQKQRASAQSKQKQSGGEWFTLILLSFLFLLAIGIGFIIAGKNDAGPLAAWFDTSKSEATLQGSNVDAVAASTTPTPIINTSTPSPTPSPSPSPNATQTAFITQTVEAKASATSGAETAVAIANITETAVVEETLNAVTATPSPTLTITPDLAATDQAIQQQTQTAVAQQTAIAAPPTLTAREKVEACDLDYVIIEPDNLEVPPRLSEARNPRLVRASNATTDTSFSFTLIIENASTCDWPLDGSLALAFVDDTESLEIDYEPLTENCQLSSDRLFTDVNFTQPQRPRFFFDTRRAVRRTEQVELEITGVAPRTRGCHFGVWQLEFTDYDQLSIGEPIIMGIQVFSGQ